MLTCSTCGVHVLDRCPTCGCEPGAGLASAGAKILGLVLGPMLAGCVSMYGLVATDRPGDCCDPSDETGGGGADDDEDGFIDENDGGEDCDDQNEDVNPAADEEAGDGVDSNCDGEDDT